jgi:hypothetical protein
VDEVVEVVEEQVSESWRWDSEWFQFGRVFDVTLYIEHEWYVHGTQLHSKRQYRHLI